MSTEHHIRNPLEMALEQLMPGAPTRASAPSRPRPWTAPVIRRIGARDLWDALRGGVSDFSAARDDVLFIALIYPIEGLVLAQLIIDRDLLPLVFPLASGFALVGPLAAVGLYEISRRREKGQTVSWIDALGVLNAPALGSIFVLGLMLVALFLLWLAAAYGVFMATLGPATPSSMGAFLNAVFTTPRGWAMIGLGTGTGFLFAVAALAISVVSFPLLLDKNVSVVRAIQTSLRAVAANPGTMALWGLIVAGALVLGSAPALLGLIFVMPVLGHATWRLYRKMIAAG